MASFSLREPKACSLRVFSPWCPKDKWMSPNGLPKDQGRKGTQKALSSWGKMTSWLVASLGPRMMG